MCKVTTFFVPLPHKILKSMKFFVKSLTYLLSVQVLSLVLMSLFRILFYVSVRPQLPPEVAAHAGWTARAFLNGLWFDNVIACYVMALPLVITVVTGLLSWWRPWLLRAYGWWFGVMYALVFMASAGNIPYFSYFSKPLNASIWNWADYGGTTLGMIFGEPAYYLYIAAYFIILGIFSYGLYTLRRRIQQQVQRTSPAIPYSRTLTWRYLLSVSGLSIALLGACFLGIRGRLGYNPIKVSAAYFCTNPVLNNLGVNPMFCLLTSTLDDMRPENKQLRLMLDAEAIRRVQHYYQRTGIEGISPIARPITPDSLPTKRNVVIVLMESMSAKLMTRFGNDKHLTPHIDSLYAHSLSFANCYSAGNHTNHGLYATLYSFPSIMFRNAMKGSDIPVYSGLPTVLKEQGYRTLFFMTHESQYDNMNAFFRTNGYDEVYAQENYPRSEVVNHFGVPDAFLFSYALPVLRQRAAEGHPFMATLLTISNHPPYVVPDAFADPSLTPEEQIVRYADHCIGSFMQQAAREPWFKNTLFVFLGDHGKMVGTANCELPESFNHIPLFIHGEGLSPREISNFAGQVDVAPTLLGMLRVPYVQNNFGIDLLREQRPAAFYTADKTIAARNATHLYVYNAETDREYCYRLDPQGTPTEAPAFGAEWQPLKDYVFSLLQTTEYMVQHGMTTDRPAQQPAGEK